MPRSSSSAAAARAIPDPATIVYHAVYRGRDVNSCVFLRWSDAERHVADFDDAEFERFDDIDDAVTFALFGPESDEGSKKSGGLGLKVAPKGDVPEEVDEDDGEDATSTPGAKGKRAGGGLRRSPRGRGANKGAPTSPTSKAAKGKATAKKKMTPASKARAAAVGGKKRKRASTPGRSDEAETNEEEEDGGGNDENADEGTTPVYGSPSDLPVKRPRASHGRGRPRKGETEPSPQWTEMFDRLRAIHDATGSVAIDRKDEDNADLRKWLVVQRYQIKENLNKWARKKMDVPPILREKVKRLEEVGVTLKGEAGGAAKGSQPKEEWCAMLEKLRVCKEETGSFEIPRGEGPYADVRKWLGRVLSDLRGGWTPEGNFVERSTGSPSPAMAEKARRLEAIGFDLSVLGERGRSGALAATTPNQAWLDMLERLKLHRGTTGSCDIHVEDEANADLRKWTQRTVAELRRCRKSEDDYVDPRTGKPSQLARVKAKMIEELGFDLSVKGRKFAKELSSEWMQMYEKLKAHKEMTGSLRISVDGKDEERAKLRSWWYAQQSKIRLEIKKLENDVAADEKKEAKLHPIIEEKARLLEELDPNVRGCHTAVSVNHLSRFDEMLGRFRQYKFEHGRDLPFSSNKEGVADLCKWSKRLREEYDRLKEGKESSTLTAFNMQRLTEAGFNFKHKNKPRVSFEDRLAQLRAFKAEHGHLYVPSRHPVLGEFVRQKRKEYNKFIEGVGTSKIIERQIQDLVALEFVFDAGRKYTPPSEPNKPWEERFKELVEYKALHGHCAVPKSYPGLGQWVKQQRYHYNAFKKGKPNRMTPERVFQLTDIGFIWDASGKHAENFYP